MAKGQECRHPHGPRQMGSRGSMQLQGESPGQVRHKGISISRRNRRLQRSPLTFLARQSTSTQPGATRALQGAARSSQRPTNPQQGSGASTAQQAQRGTAQTTDVQEKGQPTDQSQTAHQQQRTAQHKHSKKSHTMSRKAHGKETAARNSNSEASNSNSKNTPREDQSAPAVLLQGSSTACTQRGQRLLRCNHLSTHLRWK